MFKAWPAAETSRVPLTQAQPPRSGFSARWRTGHASAEQPLSPGAVADAGRDDDYARGYADGANASACAYADEREALIRLVATAQALQPEPSEELAAMIATTVERLVAELVETAPIDRAVLMARIGRAVALIEEADRAQTLCLHPDDFTLLAGAALPLTPRADPSVERGGLRIDCSAGWIEDRRSFHLDALHTQLGMGHDT